jgi:hypothetical protein
MVGPEGNDPSPTGYEPDALPCVLRAQIYSKIYPIISPERTVASIIPNHHTICSYGQNNKAPRDSIIVAIKIYPGISVFIIYFLFGSP